MKELLKTLGSSTPYSNKLKILPSKGGSASFGRIRIHIHLNQIKANLYVIPENSTYCPHVENYYQCNADEK
jgi:hypothetical protein